MNKKVLTAIGLSLALFTVEPVMATVNKDMVMGRPEVNHPESDVERLGNMLNLSAEQKAKIESILEEEWPQMIKLVGER